MQDRTIAHKQRSINITGRFRLKKNAEVKAHEASTSAKVKSDSYCVKS
ncbi:MAG: hypothetical protein QOH25_4020 [Acidobacteriota bacterium]|jgi:hypothetical protein|nr:hypothetical protein [Acidobacteriota bacterium]